MIRDADDRPERVVHGLKRRLEHHRYRAEHLDDALDRLECVAGAELRLLGEAIGVEVIVESHTVHSVPPTVDGAAVRTVSTHAPESTVPIVTAVTTSSS